MKPVDKILLDLSYSKLNEKFDLFPVNDKRILSSFCNQLRSGKFLTENQGKLLLKILNENITKLTPVYDDLSFLKNPIWSEPFRIIEQTKRIFLVPGDNTNFFIEYSFNKRIKETLTGIILKEKISINIINNKTTSLLLTEDNIYKIIKALRSFKFDIDQVLLNFYKEIEEIKKTTDNVEYSFLESNSKIKNMLEKELGADYKNNTLLLLDRQIKYSYRLRPIKIDNTLDYSIASRIKPRIWINSNNIDMTTLINSITNLKRFPILFILDGHKPIESTEQLKKIYQIIKTINKTCSVFFRLDTKVGDDFNKFISNNNLNTWLYKDTDAVIIDNSKLPKFFNTSNWYPSSVISFTNNFNNNKITVWCDQVDCIIYYTAMKPIMADHHEVV